MLLLLQKGQLRQEKSVCVCLLLTAWFKIWSIERVFLAEVAEVSLAVLELNLTGEFGTCLTAEGERMGEEEEEEPMPEEVEMVEMEFLCELGDSLDWAA